MIFGPGISVPTITGTRVVYPARIVAAWFVLAVASIGLGQVVRLSKLRIRRWTRIDPFRWFDSSSRDRDTEREPYTVEDLEAELQWERQWWRRKAQLARRTVVVGPVTEELIFRGGPLLLALTLDGYRIPLLVAGSLLWAALHTRNPPRFRQSTGPVFVGGLLFVYLWAVGLWWVAILVHAFNNGVAMALSVGSEWRRRRHPSFTPGDECTVTVDDHCPPYKWHGMCQAYTQADEELLVAGVEPGESTRVRVATTTGFVPYAYPVDQTRGETE